MIKTVAYLAPEIPSLSGTFVFNEIFALEAEGVQVIPISVHQIKLSVQSPEVEDLFNRTTFLYHQSKAAILKANLATFINHPVRYLATLGCVIGDMFRAGITKLASLKLLFQFLQASKVVQTMQRHQCQHLHIHFAHVPTQIGMYASLLSNIPFTFTSHANDLFERGLLLTTKAKRAKKAIAISDYNRRFLMSLGVPPEKIKIVRCGIDSQKRSFQKKISFNTTPVIGTLARLVEKKGVDDLILALSILHQKGVDFVLEIGGDGPLLGTLKTLVAEHNLDAKVRFKGSMDHDSVFSWLQHLDVFVLACKRDKEGDQDGIPVVLMEAMAVGIPVISTQISGIPELIHNGDSGFLANPGDPESLAGALSQLLNQTDSVAQLTLNARQQITDEFDQSVNIHRLLEVFN